MTDVKGDSNATASIHTAAQDKATKNADVNKPKFTQALLHRYLYCTMWCACSGLYPRNSVGLVITMVDDQVEKKRTDATTTTSGPSTKPPTDDAAATAAADKKVEPKVYGLVPDDMYETWLLASDQIQDASAKLSLDQVLDKLQPHIEAGRIQRAMVSLPYKDEMRFPDDQGLEYHNRSGGKCNFFAQHGLLACVLDSRSRSASETSEVEN